MQLHDLHPKHKLKKRKRVGRGGKRGTYSGRGLKGQKSRAGRRLKPIIRSLIKRYPKLRGYKFKPLGVKSAIVNIEILEKTFKTGDRISPQILMDQQIIRKIKGKIPKVKILGTGKLTKALTLEGCQVSKAAKEKITKAHGMVK